MSRNLKRTLIAGAVLIVAGAGAGGAAAVQGGADDDVATGAQAERAAAAAVKIAGGGSAASVERDTEGDRVWEIEVTKADRSSVEVDLDAALQRVSSEAEDSESDSGETDR